MPGPDGVGQRAAARRLDVDPLLAVVDRTRRYVEARAFDDVARARRRATARSGGPGSGRRRSRACRSRRHLEVHRARRPPIARCSSASAIGSRSAGDVHVATCAPTRRRARRAGTAAVRGRPDDAAARRARTSRDQRRPSRAPRRARRPGAPRSALCQPGPQPRSAAHAGGHPRPRTRAIDGGSGRRRCAIHSVGAAARTRRRSCGPRREASRRTWTHSDGRGSASSTTSRTRSPRSSSPTRRVRSRCRAARPPDGATSGCAARPIDWSDVDVFFGDERFVPVDASRLERGHGPRACCSTQVATARDPLDVPAGPDRGGGRRATTRSCAPRRRSTSCTSGSGPTATPRRCSPARRRSTRRDRFVVATGDDAAPAPAADVHVPRDRPRARSSSSPSRGAEKRDAIARIRAGDDLPAARGSAAERVLWLVDRGRRGRPLGSPQCVSASIVRDAARRAPRRADGRGRAARATRSHGARVTFSPKVFIPLTMLCRDRCGYCTFAKPPARLDAPVPHARRRARDRAAGRRARLPRGAVHARRGARGALPARGRVARRARVRLDGRLPRRRRAGACSTRPACSPTPTPARSRRPSSTRLRAVSPSQGMMIETLADPPRRARRPAPRRARQDARTPARHARRRRPGRASRSPPASSSASARRAPSASTRWSRSRDAHAAPRSRAGGDRPELPAEAGHRDAHAPRRARPTSSSGRSRPRG